MSYLNTTLFDGYVDYFFVCPQQIVRRARQFPAPDVFGKRHARRQAEKPLERRYRRKRDFAYLIVIHAAAQVFFYVTYRVVQPVYRFH